MLYIVVITIPEIDIDFSIDYECKADPKGNTLRHIMEMYKGKTAQFKDPRMQGYRGTCRAIIQDENNRSKVLYNNGWEREN